MTEETSLIPVTSRHDALGVLKLVSNNKPNRDLAPYIKALMTHADEQTFAMMRGSGNEMPPAEQLVTLMAGNGFITTDEAYECLEERDVAKGRPAE